MDQNTSMRLRAGGNGTAIAQATLESGVLWGRVLTGSGIDFGNGSVVVGVRGTSVALSESSSSITIVDSKIDPNNGNIAEIYTQNGVSF